MGAQSLSLVRPTGTVAGRNGLDADSSGPVRYDRSLPGDLVLILPEGREYDLVIHATVPKRGWQVMQNGGPVSAPFPGSAICYKGNFYEVVDMGSVDLNARFPYCYQLRRWDENVAMRSTFTYSPESQAEEQRRWNEDVREGKISSQIVFLYPLLGLLPRAIQQKIGNRVVHGGITNDLERREADHQQRWPNSHITQVGRRTTPEAARQWEKDKGYT